MATPHEIVARWDARKKREAAIARARKSVTNDNEPRGPTGYFIFDGKPEPYWNAFGTQFQPDEIGNNVASAPPAEVARGSVQRA